jgi:hypothetical protein
MKFTPGTPKPPTSGRKKGTPNRATVAMRNAVMETFMRLGGVEGFTQWAEKNPFEFYKIAARLVRPDVKALNAAPPPFKLITDLESQADKKRLAQTISSEPQEADGQSASTAERARAKGARLKRSFQCTLGSAPGSSPEDSS